MILVDTSVWIDHLRHNEPRLAQALENDTVLCHPFVIGELACGNLKNRAQLLQLLKNLPGAIIATDSEATAFIETHRLMGRGIGYLDVHLLAATALTDNATLWTRDKALAAIANELNLGFL